MQPAESDIDGRPERGETIAVLGAGGAMGSPMARNLLRADMGVRAWDRTRAKAEALADQGAVVADTPAEAAAGASMILTMLADTEAVLSAMEGEHGALESISGSVLWVQMSTIGEAGTQRGAEAAAAHGGVLVDAAVLGAPQPAEEGKLVVMASGPDDEDVRERL